MVQMKKIKIKIKKQTYKFELRKKYFNKRKFKIVEKKPIELISNALKEVLFPKKTSLTDVRKPIIAFAIFIILLLLFSMLLFSGTNNTQVVQNVTFQAPQLVVNFQEGGIVNIGGRVRDSVVGYYKLNYSVSGADSITIKTEIYKERIPNQVFVLVSKMDQATNYQLFKYELKRRLEAKGLPLNEMSLDQVETLPAGSVLIIPSGLLPEKLTQPGNANLLTLANRGVLILYIGQRFDSEGFTITESGSRKGISPEFASKLPFTFVPANLVSSNKSLNILNTYYMAKTSSGNSGTLLYGTISLVTTQQGGKLLLVPQVLDHGWNSPALAAEDIDKIITEIKWALPQNERQHTYSIQGNASDYSFFFSPPFSEKEKTIVARVIASHGGNTTEKLHVFYMRQDVKGNLFFSEDMLHLVSGTITEKETSFIAALRENTTEERRLFMSVRDINGNELLRTPLAQGASGRVPLLGDTEFSERLNLDKGVYLASVVDEDNKPYARMIIEIIDVNISVVSQSFDKNLFVFSSTVDGQSIKINQVKVIVDGKYSYQFTDSSEFRINMEKDLRGEQLSPGNHSFVFEYSGLKKVVVLQRFASSQFYENPIYWIMGIIALLIFVGTPYLAALLRKEMYALDIPDFPPLSRIKIPMKKEMVFGVLEKVNEDYKWKNTPLTLEEIKKGFKKIIYQNRAVFISDYNLEYILEKLHNKGDVKSALEYYGLTKWEVETGKSIKYLAMQRKIRDICINEAIAFSRSEEKTKCDMYLKVLGQDVFVYIMDLPATREEKLTLALRAIQKGLVVLLFENAEEKKDFEDTINSASEGGGLVKLEIMAGSIVPLEIKELEKMLKEMKNI